MEVEALIVSKTLMNNQTCVGGLVLESNRYIRLLNRGNQNQPLDTQFEIGDIWNLKTINRNPLIPPHIEDVIVLNKEFVRVEEDLSALFISRSLIDWNGHVDNVFDKCISWAKSGSGYVPLNEEYPSKSVGFWVADKDLALKRYEYDGKPKLKYKYFNGLEHRNIPFVGTQDPLEVIEEGTIIRLSLSREFPPDYKKFDVPKGFYLQLSGWYA